MIHVIATIELRPGTRDAFLDEFQKIVPLVHAEEGCVEYVPVVDIETGISRAAPPRANVVTIVEKWESLPQLEAHLATEHMARYRERVKDFVVASSLRIAASSS